MKGEAAVRGVDAAVAGDVPDRGAIVVEVAGRRMARGPARKPLRRYQAEVIDGIVRVALPS